MNYYPKKTQKQFRKNKNLFFLFLVATLGLVGAVALSSGKRTGYSEGTNSTFQVEKRAGKIGIGESKWGSNTTAKLSANVNYSYIVPPEQDSIKAENIDDHTRGGNCSLTDVSTTSVSLFAYSFYVWNNTSTAISFTYKMSISNGLKNSKDFTNYGKIGIFCNESSSANHEAITNDQLNAGDASYFAFSKVYENLKPGVALSFTVFLYFSGEGVPQKIDNTKDVRLRMWFFN